MVGNDRRGAIPLFVGVTGHRAIAPDHANLAETLIQQRFAELAKSYPNTPVVVLSALAEGADRIVARAALARDLELIVPLPVSLERYREDFKTPESREEFEALLVRARAAFVVPNSSRSLADEDRYADLGVFIAKSSDLLIALWDGLPARGPGGTGEVVELRSEQPTDVIVVSREPSTTVDGVDASFSDSPEAWKQIDDFNSDAAAQSSQGAEPSVFTVADGLAMRYRNLQMRTLDATFGLIAAAVLALGGYALDVTLGEAGRTNAPTLWFLTAEILAFIAAFAVVYVARAKRYESKAQDYRALSEALRIQSFYDALMLPDDISSQYLQKHERQLEWIVKALRSSLRYGRWRNGCAEPVPTVESLESIRERWVLDQKRFFARAADRDERRDLRAKRASGMLILTSIVLTLVLFADELAGFHQSHAPYLREVLLFAITVSAAFAALVRGYADRCAWAYHAREYERMRELYDSTDSALSRLIESRDRGDEARALLSQLAREALSENADWLLVHRERPIEIPDT